MLYIEVSNQQEADTLIRPLLEHEPLFRSVQFSTSIVFWKILKWPHAITYWCPVDKEAKTFVTDTRVSRGLEEFFYRCADCKTFEVFFSAIVDRKPSQENGMTQYFDVEIKMIGQFPRRAVEIPRDLGKFLGKEDSDLYKKALVSLSLSYGIGALAYFRRILKNKASEILKLIIEIRSQEGADEEELEDLKNTAMERSSDEMLKKAAQVLPGYLRPGGENPLDFLYGVASENMHAKDEEACIHTALEVDQSLRFVITRTYDQLETQKDYREAMKKLRDER